MPDNEDRNDEVLIPLYEENNGSLETDNSSGIQKDIKLCPECGTVHDPSLEYSKCHGQPLYLAWKCRDCGEDFDKYADSSEIKFCPECGKQLTEAQHEIVNEGRTKDNIDKKTRYKCTNAECGIEYEDESQFCGKCGGALEKLECKACGEPYQKSKAGEYNKYCTVCGNMTTMTQEGRQAEEERLKKEAEEEDKKKKKKHFFITIVSTLIICLMIYAALIFISQFGGFGGVIKAAKDRVEINIQKNTQDIMALADDYSYGFNGKERNNVKACELYKKAAKQGNVEAQVRIGHCYEYVDQYNIRKKDNTKEDYAEAIKWYRKAAKGGNAEAMVHLGDWYYKGYNWKGAVEDKAEAVKWYRKAAEQYETAFYGSLAMKKLAEMYEKGEGGLPQSNSEAIKLYEMLKAKGYYGDYADAALIRLRGETTPQTE